MDHRSLRATAGISLCIEIIIAIGHLADLLIGTSLKLVWKFVGDGHFVDKAYDQMSSRWMWSKRRDAKFDLVCVNLILNRRKLMLFCTAASRIQCRDCLRNKSTCSLEGCGNWILLACLEFS